MKKMFIFALLVAFCLLPLYSQTEEEETSMPDVGSTVISTDFSFNWGIMADDTFKFSPYYPNWGFNLDIVISNFLMISPELYLISEEFRFKRLWLAPGVLLNLKLSTYFFGAGVVKWFKISGDAVNSEWLLKLNAGFEKNLRFMVFAVTSFKDLFETTIFGLTIGFRF